MTYAGAYGRDGAVTVYRMMRREGHVLGVRRDEATRIAAAEAAEVASANKRWTFGVAAGALLVAGTFAAGALGIAGGESPVAGSPPGHTPATPGAPIADHQADQQRQSLRQDDPRGGQTAPASAAPRAVVPVPSGSGVDAPRGGADQGGVPVSGAVAAPVPVPQQPAPQPSAPSRQGPLGQVVTPVTDAVDDVLTPVTDAVGGLLSPLSGGSSAQRGTSAPAGPALTMIDPLGDLLGV